VFSGGLQNFHLDRGNADGLLGGAVRRYGTSRIAGGVVKRHLPVGAAI